MRQCEHSCTDDCVGEVAHAGQHGGMAGLPCSLWRIGHAGKHVAENQHSRNLRDAPPTMSAEEPEAPLEMDEGFGPLPVSKLEEFGIASYDCKRLKEAGFHTLESVAFTPKKTLVTVKGLSEQKVDKILFEGACTLTSGKDRPAWIHDGH